MKILAQSGVDRRLALIAFPLCIFALPMGLENDAAQPLSLLLFLPILYKCRGGLLLAAPLLVLVLMNSLSQAGHPYAEHSLFQLARMGIPFVYFCTLLAGYPQLRASLVEAAGGYSTALSRYLDAAIFIFAAGQMVQVLLFRAGLNLGNVASFSDEAGRILLYPTTASLLVFFYAVYTRKIALLLMTIVVLLASGSKAVMITALALFVYASATALSLRGIALVLAASAVLVLVLAFGNLLAIERLESFFTEYRGQDVTRQWEISEARKSWLTDASTMLFGNGMMVTVTPGIPTPDPAWAECSKYDIENGYWAILTRLGLFGGTLFLLLFHRLGISVVTFAVLRIWAIFCFKTSYQFMTTLDGCYLLLFAAVIDYNIRTRSFLERAKRWHVNREPRPLSVREAAT